MRVRNPDLYHFIDLDVSLSANSFLRDTVAFDSSVQIYYIGYYKPFSRLFFEVDTASTSGDLSFAYFDGSSYVELPNLRDDTKSMQRSGFVSWQFEQDDDITGSWKTDTQDGQSLYWVRISGTAEPVVFDGVNIVFSDDQDLKAEFPRVEDFRQTGLDTFINFHVSARDEIVNRLRTGGEAVRKDTINSDFKISSLKFRGKDIRQINKFDILDVEEIRQASKFLTLSKIFDYVSANNQDKAAMRADMYMHKFSQAFKLFYMTLDKDDDGNVDTSENLAINNIDIQLV